MHHRALRRRSRSTNSSARIARCRICRRRPLGNAAAASATSRAARVGHGATARRGPGAGHPRPSDRHALQRPLGRPAALLDGHRPRDLLRHEPHRHRADGFLLSGARREQGDLPPRRECRATWHDGFSTHAADRDGAGDRRAAAQAIISPGRASPLRRGLRRPTNVRAGANLPHPGRASSRCRIPPGATAAGSRRTPGSRREFLPELKLVQKSKRGKSRGERRFGVWLGVRRINSDDREGFPNRRFSDSIWECRRRTSTPFPLPN